MFQPVSGKGSRVNLAVARFFLSTFILPHPPGELSHPKFRSSAFVRPTNYNVDESVLRLKPKNWLSSLPPWCHPKPTPNPAPNPDETDSSERSTGSESITWRLVVATFWMGAINCTILLVAAMMNPKSVAPVSWMNTLKTNA